MRLHHLLIHCVNPEGERSRGVGGSGAGLGRWGVDRVGVTGGRLGSRKEGAGFGARLGSGERWAGLGAGLGEGAGCGWGQGWGQD